MPAFSLLALLQSYRDLNSVTQIAFPILFAIVLGLGWWAHRQSRLAAEQADRDAAARIAFLVAQQTRPVRVHQALKGGHRGAR